MALTENRKAIIWSALDKVGTYIINFAIQIILARLLCPDDYAVVAMLAIFISISQAFIDSGFHTTLIQRRDCTQIDYSSVFYFNIIIGAIVYALFYFISPIIESFYNFEGLSLVIKVYFSTLFINSFSMVHRAIMTKELNFKKVTFITLSTSVISSIPAIIMAYYGCGYWALVIQSILSSLLSSSLIMYSSGWRPSFNFSYKSLQKLAPFGLKMLVIYIFHAIYNNIYSLVIGKNYTSQSLGIYDRSKTLSSMGPVGFSDFYTRALYPIQAKNQENNSIMESTYNRSFTLMCLVIVPITAFMFFFADETIYTLFGSQWLECSAFLQILAFGYMVYPLQALNMNMLKAKGRADMMLKAEVIKKIVGITCLLLLTHFDLKALVLGWTFCALFDFLISEFYYKKLFSFSIIRPFKFLFSTIIIAFSLSYLISFLSNSFIENIYIRFFLGGVVFVTVYFVINYKNIKSLL